MVPLVPFDILLKGTPTAMALGSRMVNLHSRSVTLSYQWYHWYGCTVQWIQIDNNTDGRWWIYEIYNPYRMVVLDQVPILMVAVALYI
jgi:hypothetical protein